MRVVGESLGRVVKKVLVGYKEFHCCEELLGCSVMRVSHDH